VFEKKGDGWEEKTLGELANFRNGMNFTKSSKGEKINIVGVKDFQNSFWVPFETLETVTLDGKLNDLDLLNKGDILAVRSNGNPQLIGRTLLASEVIGQVSHSGFTIRIRLNTKCIDPIYLCNYLKITKTRKILVDGGNGVGIKSLNQGSLSALSIPFPRSIKIQQEIVNKLDFFSTETQKLETIYEKKLDDLEELKKSILQKAFSGDLPIRQAGLTGREVEV
jgi:type I restriction enzyme S subunit